MSDKEWKFISDYSVDSYQCGLKAGDNLRLKSSILIRDHDGNETGEVHEIGQIWKVLPGSKEDPGVIWLQQEDGKRHTWDDDDNIFETFEKLDT